MVLVTEGSSTAVSSCDFVPTCLLTVATSVSIFDTDSDAFDTSVSSILDFFFAFFFLGAFFFVTIDS